MACESVYHKILAGDVLGRMDVKNDFLLMIFETH